MSRSGLSDPVVINQIQTRGVQQQPQVSDIIMMHQQGVSDTVITAMQSARIGSAPQVIETSPVIVQPSPVYVEERVIVPLSTASGVPRSRVSLPSWPALSLVTDDC